MAYDFISLVCPRCGNKFRADYCSNCQHSDCIKLKEYSNGWFAECTRCGTSAQWCTCPKCGANVHVYKNKACFLTNACCSYMGKADDCKELTVLRNFRDEYMLADEKMSQDVTLYYAIAPKLIKKIDVSEEKDAIYDDIYNNLVCKCIEMIENNQYEAAYNHYKNYVYSLCEKYDVDCQQ